MTERPNSLAEQSSEARKPDGGRARIVLRPLDQVVFGFGTLLAMLAIVVGVVMLVDSRGRFPYVLIGGVVIGGCALWYLRRRYRHERVVHGLPAEPPHEPKPHDAAPAVETTDPDVAEEPDSLDE
ncbi:MAG TPA: hypothetical protein VGJ28_25590 [Micromonosporaceae bacterium]